MKLTSHDNRRLQERIINTVARKLQYLHKKSYCNEPISYAPVWYTIAAFEHQVPSLTKHHVLKQSGSQQTQQDISLNAADQAWLDRFPGRRNVRDYAMPKPLSYQDICDVFNQFDKDVRHIQFTEHDKDAWCRYAIALCQPTP